VSATTTNHAELRDRLVAWLNERFADDGPEILAETPLFVGGRLDSLRILELIAWTERAIGREIEDAEIRTDNFASAARIGEVFAHGGHDAHR
jgi:acyl carrier protein